MPAAEEVGTCLLAPVAWVHDPLGVARVAGVLDSLRTAAEVEEAGRNQRPGLVVVEGPEGRVVVTVLLPPIERGAQSGSSVGGLGRWHRRVEVLLREARLLSQDLPLRDPSFGRGYQEVVGAEGC